MNEIAFIIPVIFILIGIEYYFNNKKNKNYYSFSSSISNISIGVCERVAQVFLASYFLVFFQYIYDHFSLFKLPSHIGTWIILFFLTDFLWYWYHRLSHEINILWGAHIVHHQSEEYNLTVSLRITIFQAVIRLGFGIVLPLIGFPVKMAAIMLGVLGVYQFFIHTRFVKNLGILEYVFVTPSHHRVHHGSNKLYLDKNFGGILIIWDRLFKTFQPETEEVKYGLTKPVNSNSFLWLHLHYWVILLENMKHTRGIYNKIKLIFDNPGKLKNDFSDELRDRYLSESVTNVTINEASFPFLYRYVKIQVVIAVTGLFLLYYLSMSTSISLLTAITIIITLINCGAVLEQKKWIFPIEIIRGVLLYALIILISQNYFLLNFAPLLLAAVIWNYTILKNNYYKMIYSNK